MSRISDRLHIFGSFSPSHEREADREKKKKKKKKKKSDEEKGEGEEKYVPNLTRTHPINIRITHLNRGLPTLHLRGLNFLHEIPFRLTRHQIARIIRTTEIRPHTHRIRKEIIAKVPEDAILRLTVFSEEDGVEGAAVLGCHPIDAVEGVYGREGTLVLVLDLGLVCWAGFFVDGA